MKKLYIIIFILLMIVVGCSKNKELKQTSEVSTQVKETEVKNTEQEREITLSAVGDILLHDRVYEKAEVEGHYDFMPMIQSMKPYLEGSDITFANQETMIGGTEMGLSSYPSFNSPQEIGDNLQEIGVDIVSLANNHTLDRGEKAIQNAINYWNKIDMNYVGSYQNQEDASNLRIMETDAGISVAFLAYTYGTNGIIRPNGKEYLVNYIDKATIKKDIKNAKSKADVTIVSLHFGTEYEPLPDEYQKDIVQFVADEEADIVLGHHPHVLQPTKWVEGKNGNEMFTVYSLGNFLSGQETLSKRIGGILNLKIKKDVNGTIQVHSPSFIPTIVSKGDWEMKPMYEIADKDLQNSKEEYNKVKKHMSQWMPELTFPEMNK